MFKWRVDTIDVVVNLKPGIYNLPSDSAMGKTYLYKLFKELALRGEPILGYRYEDEYLSGDLVQRIEHCQPQVILLDRYNRFAPRYDDLICRLGENIVVLVDYKNSKILMGTPCSLRMDHSCIEVSR